MNIAVFQKFFWNIKKILIFSLFFLLPLVNSHLLNLFGIDWNIFVRGNYEFTKVVFFNIFSFLIILVYLITFLLDYLTSIYPPNEHTYKIKKSVNFLKNLYLKLNIFFSKLINQCQKYIFRIELIKNTKHSSDEEKINIPYLLFIFSFFFILIISTIFSISPIVSLFGNSEKAHSIFMFLNLVGLFVILSNQKKEFLKKILLISLCSGVIVSIIGVWQYYLPNFNYQELNNRAISTFGHPNYLTLYILMLIPIIFSKKYIKSFLIKTILLIPITFALILTKSVLGLILFIGYFFYKTFTFFKFKKLFIFLLFFIFVTIFLLFNFYENLFYLKIHSFVSRYFIWETSISIIFSDIKVFFLGGGLETLKLVFDNFKSPYLYIFENIGFTADRPHNLFLNFFYHFGILGFLWIIIFIYFIIKLSLEEKKVYLEVIVVFLFFTFFNFASIGAYLLFITIVAIISKNKRKYKNQSKIWGFIFFIFIFFSSVFSAFYGLKFYIAENHFYKGDIEKAISKFQYNPDYFSYKLDYNKLLKIEKFKSEKYYKSKILKINEKLKNCENLTYYYPSVENFFLCGKILEKFNHKNSAKEFYKLGLKRLPDLWNQNSKYWDNFLVKNTINGNRFFSEKYSDIKIILEKTK